MKKWLLNELKELRIVYKGYEKTGEEELKLEYEGRIREVEYILHCLFNIEEETFKFIRG